MKINIVTGFFLPVPPVQGGATEKIWHRLATEFANNGHEVTFASRQWPGFPDSEVVEGVRHVRIAGQDHTRSLPVNLWRDFRWGRRVTAVLPSADVTICNTVMMPIWLRKRRPDAGRVVAVMARMPKGQIRFYRGVDLILSLSAAVTAAIARERPEIAARTRPFPFPIDWDRQAQAAATYRAVRDSSAPITIGFIGRVHPEKGITVLLEAAALLAKDGDLPTWNLAVTGPVSIPQGGGGEAFAEALWARYRNTLGGRLSIQGPEFNPSQLARRYAEIDLFCYPSLAERGETFGVAVAEAMAAQCAPVVSGLACFNELVTPDVTGLVFDHRAPNAAEHLATALRRLLRDPELRAQIAVRAQQHVRAYDYSEIARAVLGHLEACVHGELRAPEVRD